MKECVAYIVLFGAMCAWLASHISYASGYADGKKSERRKKERRKEPKDAD